MTRNEALEEVSGLRRILTEQIKTNEELARKVAMLQSIIVATVFDIDMAGRIDSSTEIALREAAKREQR